MKEQTPFFNHLYTPEVKAERHTIIMELAHDIDRCLRDPYIYTKQHSAFPGFLASIAEVMLPFFVSKVKVPKKYCIATGDTLELLVHHFRGYMDLLCIRQICTPTFSDETLRNGFAKQIGSLNFAHEAAPPTLEGAFEMACQNETFTYTALINLFVIQALLKSTSWSTVNLAGVDELRAALFKNVHFYTKRKLTFGGLLGGEFLKKALRESVEDSLYTPTGAVNYSIIECLRPFGNIPGQYLTSEDENFRNAIKLAYEKL